jgi:hypothetical protein
MMEGVTVLLAAAVASARGMGDGRRRAGDLPSGRTACKRGFFFYILGLISLAAWDGYGIYDHGIALSVELLIERIRHPWRWRPRRLRTIAHLL